MLPHLDDAEIPVPSALFQFAWKNREKIMTMDRLCYPEPDWYREIESPDDLISPVILKDDWGASIRITKNPMGGFSFDGETCSGHRYYVLEDKKNDKVVIFLTEDPSDYFIPLLLTLNKYAEDFGMKKCKILIDQSKYRKLIYDDLFEHFAKSPRHHSNLVRSDIKEGVYEMIHKCNFYTITVPGQGSLGGYLACTPLEVYYDLQLLVGL